MDLSNEARGHIPNETLLRQGLFYGQRKVPLAMAANLLFLSTCPACPEGSRKNWHAGYVPGIQNLYLLSRNHGFAEYEPRVILNAG